MIVSFRAALASTSPQRTRTLAGGGMTRLLCSTYELSVCAGLQALREHHGVHSCRRASINSCKSFKEPGTRI